MRVVALVSLIAVAAIAYPAAGGAQEYSVGYQAAVGATSAVAVGSGLPGSPVQAVAWSRKGKFWLHANLGGGYGAMSADDPTVGEVKLSGAAGVGGVALGAFISDNVVLFGDIIVNVLSGPTVEIGTQEFETTDEFTATAGGVGAGIGYVGPSAFVIQASVAASYLTFEAPIGAGTVQASTNPGFGARLAVGKDWFVSSKIALGVAGHGYWGTMKDKGDNAPTWTAYGLGVTFSFLWVPKGLRAPGAP